MRADETSLQGWIAAVVDQDQAGLNCLYDALIAQVYGLALRITRQSQLAEEVAQDTFWQVWRQAPRFDANKGSAKAWVMTIARSRALDALRSLNPEECELEPDILALIQAEDNTMPPNLLMAVQQDHGLHAALATLDAMPRQLLSLAFFRGLSHDEIALFSGMPLGTVKSHIRRALLALQGILTVNAAEPN
ncbi:MAG: RNA polymerase subunit sigma-24 [Proteobacteria bacterium ST_bin11]|nr:MAG: RNA polymerase subunit sigma-24 [Proteobacteria bacterium ST_bin11]